MRVSTNMIYDQGVIALQKQSAALLYTGQQIATGRKILTPSDDPVGSARALDVSQSKSVNQQFITNQGYAEDALKLVEGQLDGAGEIIQYARDRVLAAGNPALSPWDTYRIYYTQDGVSEPTTNDPFVDASTLSDLGTNTSASVTMQGLSMGAEYRLAMAGLDRAGNLGPISGVQTVTLGQIIITQAYANAQSHPVMSWLGNPSAFYDVIYADSTGYTPNIDTQWKLAAMVFGTTWTDEGGIDEGTGNVRLAPMQLPNKSMRFYRVAVANAWVPTAARLGGATTQIVVALKTVLTNGYNFIGMGMTPFENTLAGFFGTNRLPASNSVAASTSVSVYEPTATGDAMTNAWWLSAVDGWRYEFGSASANTQAIPYPYTGFNVQIPDTAPPSTNLLLLGRVPWTNPPAFSLQTNRYHVVTLNLPRPTRLGETGLKDYVARGTSIFVADEIRVLQRGLGPFGSPKARVFVNTAGDYRYHTGGSGSASVAQKHQVRSFCCLVSRSSSNIFLSLKPGRRASSRASVRPERPAPARMIS